MKYFNVPYDSNPYKLMRCVLDILDSVDEDDIKNNNDMIARIISERRGIDINSIHGVAFEINDFNCMNHHGYFVVYFDSFENCHLDNISEYYDLCDRARCEGSYPNNLGIGNTVVCGFYPREFKSREFAIEHPIHYAITCSLIARHLWNNVYFSENRINAYDELSEYSTDFMSHLWSIYLYRRLHMLKPEVVVLDGELDKFNEMDYIGHLNYVCKHIREFTDEMDKILDPVDQDEQNQENDGE